MNKKAIFAFDVLMTFVKILLLIIVMVAIIALIRSFLVMEIDTFDAEAELFTQNVLYSNALMFYDNDIDRFYPAMVDLNKFTADDVEESLNKSISYGNNKKIAAKITLKDFEGDYINSLQFNKEWYLKWKGVPSWIPGPGGAKDRQKTVFVLIKDGNELEKGYLEFDIIIPNR